MIGRMRRGARVSTASRYLSPLLLLALVLSLSAPLAQANNQMAPQAAALTSLQGQMTQRMPAQRQIRAAILPRAVPAASLASRAASPAPPVTIASVQGQFFPNPNNSGTFDVTPGTLTSFAQSFETIDFNPPASAQVSCTASTGIDENSRPFTDVIPQPNGTCQTQVAQGGGQQAGVGSLNAFEAVFTTLITVQAPGQVTFNFFSDDGWILGVGPLRGQSGSAYQPSYISGSLTNPPSGNTTAFNRLAVVGSFNQVSPPAQNQVTVSFPYAGTYPMEVDYTECCSGQLALMLGTTYQNPILPGSITGPSTPETRSPREKYTTCSEVAPVNCATGDFYHDFTDLAIPGRGIPVHFTRTYNSLNAAQDGPLGFGWTDNYNMNLSTDSTGAITVHEETGSTITFSLSGSAYQAPSRVLATLTQNGDGTFTLADRDQTKYVFNAPTISTTGQLLKITDRNNYATTLNYSGGRLATVTDPANRTLTFGYNAAGRIATVTDPISRTVSFGYDGSGNLTTATDVAQGVTAFTYDANHLLLTMADPNHGVVTNHYDGSARVTSQTDPMSRTTTLSYTPNADGSQTTTLTDPKGNVTTELYQNNELIAKTVGVGTPQAATTSYTYDPATLGITSVTDPNNHVSLFSYDSLGNLISATDPLTRTTTLSYDGLNDLTTATDPLSITTQLSYDSAGNLLSIARPLTNSGGSVGSAHVSAGTGLRPRSHGSARATAVAGDRAQSAVSGRQARGSAPASPPVGSSKAKVTVAALGKLPLRFERNVGQTDGQVSFLARGAGYTLFLTPHEAVLSLSAAAPATHGRPGAPRAAGEGRVTAKQAVVRLALAGANAHPAVVGLDRLPGESNYFIGNDPRHWQTHVPGYARVAYRDVYPGVDLVYHGGSGRLEYDFVVAPGADPRAIRLAVAGARQLRLDAHGNLVLQGSGGALVQDRPVAYQEVHGTRRAVSASYVLSGAGQIGITLGGYNHGQRLIIDPVLVFSTYLGGSGSETAVGVAVDTDGNVYVVGDTASTNLPVANALQATNAGGQDAFIAKLNVSGSALVYSTYVGGSGNENARGIAVDSAGNAYVHGDTVSTDFPIVAALQPTLAGMSDTFVVKLSPTGSTILYSTYLGGSANDSAGGITIDSVGDAYVTGQTLSTNFPTTRSSLQTKIKGNSDAYIAKLNASGSALVYSTYLGGSTNDNGGSIAVDSAGNAYVAGRTDSINFPVTSGTFQSRFAGGTFDAFLAKVNGSGSALVYSTYLGGSGDDEAYSVAVDGVGNAYVAGSTNSTSFPVVGAFQASNRGQSDAFVTKMNAAGTALVYSTYLGGSSWDYANAIAVDGAGSAYLTGYTASTDFPTTAGAVQPTFGGNYDAFVAELTGLGNALVYGSYLGGSAGETGQGIAVDGAGNVYLTGTTTSTNFPIINALQGTNGGGYDAFLTKIGTPTTITATTTLAYDPSHPGDVTGVSDPNGHTTHLVYDAQGDLTGVTDALSDTTTVAYNGIGWPTSMVSPNGNVTGANPLSYTTTLAYNNFGDLLTSTDPLSHTARYQYDGDRNVTAATDPLSNTTRFSYDLDNENTATTRADNSVLRLGYDLDGNVITHTDALTDTTTYAFDPLNRVSSMTDPLGRTTAYQYDAASNLTGLTDALTRTTTLGYDPANELTAINYSDGVTPNVAYSYTLDGQRLTMQDGTGTSRYKYDSLNRLIQSANGAGKTVGYGYDLGGNLTTLTYPDNSKVTRSYDAANRLTGVSDWLGHTTGFSYDHDSNLTNEQFPSNAQGGGYNPADQLGSITGLLGYVYGRDRLGQLLTSSFTPGAGMSQQESTHTYGYDALNRLTGDQQPNHTTTWSYNAADELTGILDTAGSTTTTSTLGYDVADELTSLLVTQGGTTTRSLTLSYNRDGDRTGQTDSVGGGTVGYTYDQADRLTSFAKGGSQWAYAYDGDGLRQSKAITSTVEPYTYDLAEGLPIIVQDGATRYIAGPGGLPVEQVDGAGTVLYYRQDQLGSTRALVDGTGAVKAQYTYDAYGNTTAISGTATTPFGYAGQYTDAESGLEYLRARYYDPATAQFLTVDPIAGATGEPYAYAGDNPENSTDPSGLCNVFVICGILDGLHRLSVNPTAACDTGTNGSGNGVDASSKKRGKFDVHAAYPDRTKVYENQKIPRLSWDPDPSAVDDAGNPIPHTRLRWDPFNTRIYQARSFDATGKAVIDIDFTQPADPNGNPRPGHVRAPSWNRTGPADPRFPQGGYTRISPDEPLDTLPDVWPEFFPLP